MRGREKKKEGQTENAKWSLRVLQGKLLERKKGKEVKKVKKAEKSCEEGKEFEILW